MNRFNPRRRVTLMTFTFLVIGTIIVYKTSLLTPYPEQKLLEQHSGSESVIKPTVLCPTISDNHSIHCESRYLGCYDAAQQIPDKNVEYDYMTPTWCISFCKSNNYRFVGIEKGKICKCFSALKKVETLLTPGKLCNVPCAGNERETCGGVSSTNMYFITGQCIKEPFSVPFVEQRQNGCFKKPNDDAEMVFHLGMASSAECFLVCQRGLHPVAAYSAEKTCWCGKMSMSFNLSHQLDTCNSSKAVQVFRTLVEDKRCGNIRLLPPAKYTRTLLASYPGSGNTWSRYLLEKATGYYTGSVYGDRILQNTGFLGESIPIKQNRTNVIKDHILFGLDKSLSWTEAAILIIRNPYRALISFINFELSSGNKHLQHAPEKTLKQELRAQALGKRLESWTGLPKRIINLGKPYLVIYYEDLVSDPISNVKKMVEFLPNPELKPNNLDERLACLSQDTKGVAKREARKRTNSLYSPEAKKIINRAIVELREMLRKAGVKKELPPYEKDPEFL